MCQNLATVVSFHPKLFLPCTTRIFSFIIFFFLFIFIVFLFLLILITYCVFLHRATSPSFYWCNKLLWTFWLHKQTFQVEQKFFSPSTYPFFSCYSFLILFSLFYIYCCSISSFCFFCFVGFFCFCTFLCNILSQHLLFATIFSSSNC